MKNHRCPLKALSLGSEGKRPLKLFKYASNKVGMIDNFASEVILTRITKEQSLPSSYSVSSIVLAGGQ